MRYANVEVKHLPLFIIKAHDLKPKFSGSAISRKQRSCLLITLHYIDQICDRLPRFTITSLTIHRFVIASVTVSCKALCDVFCTNSRYAQVGGIKVNELNLLEREFLNIIDWRLFVSVAIGHSILVDVRPCVGLCASYGTSR